MRSGHESSVQVTRLDCQRAFEHEQHSRKLERKEKSQKGNEDKRDFSLEQTIFIGGFREPRPE